MADEECSKDYVFCALCRKNHDQGRKHVYSKKHSKVLESVLSKFGRKVRSDFLVYKINIWPVEAECQSDLHVS
jgi:hypothetical protein